jgi:hypothetical protein
VETQQSKADLADRALPLRVLRMMWPQHRDGLIAGELGSEISLSLQPEGKDLAVRCILNLDDGGPRENISIVIPPFG